MSIGPVTWTHIGGATRGIHGPSGFPASDMNCCCLSGGETCNPTYNRWLYNRIGDPGEGVELDEAFLTSLPAGAAMGDWTICGFVYGGPQRLLHAAMRFATVPINQGVSVANAFLRMRIWAGGAPDCSAQLSLTILGHDVDDAPEVHWAVTNPQTTHNNMITQGTTAQVPWLFLQPDPVACPSRQADPDIEQSGGNWFILTPNVAPIVNEILSRPGWVNGNAMTFFFKATLFEQAWFAGAVDVLLENHPTLPQLHTVIRRRDGQPWGNDGFIVGALLKITAPAVPDMDNDKFCIRDIIGDALYMGIISTWADHTNVTVSLVGKNRTTSAFDGQTPETGIRQDYLLYAYPDMSQNCLVYAY